MANILICEDDKLIGRIIERKMQDDHHKVRLVENGALAIRQFHSEIFQLVISDVMMPINSGLDVINHLRNEIHSNVPILIISALSETDNIQEAMNLGANDYLSKPFSVNDLKNKVNHLINGEGLKVPAGINRVPEKTLHLSFDPR